MLFWFFIKVLVGLGICHKAFLSDIVSTMAKANIQLAAAEMFQYTQVI